MSFCKDHYDGEQKSGEIDIAFDGNAGIDRNLLVVNGYEYRGSGNLSAIAPTTRGRITGMVTANYNGGTASIFQRAAPESSGLRFTANDPSSRPSRK